MGQSPKRQLGPDARQAPLGEYNEVLEKFLREMLAVSLLYFYGGNSCAGILCLAQDTRHA
jgi:hypothetical protein